MNVKSITMAFLVWSGFATSTFAASEYALSTTGVESYDLVAYHNSKRPLGGNGHYVSVHDGVKYLFANEQNKKAFDRKSGKYLPTYGSYYAFGISVGKKFVSDPEVWRVVDGQLYPNLDTNIQDQWLKDVPGRIKAADTNRLSIRLFDPDLSRAHLITGASP